MKVRLFARAGDSATATEHTSGVIEVPDGSTDDDLNEMAADFATDAVKPESWWERVE